VLAALAVGSARAQLVTSSPFMPPQSAAAGAPTQNAPLQYMGFIQTPTEGVKYRLYEPASKKGSWVKLNERDSTFGVVAKQFDPDRKTLTVEQDGRALTLAEREGKIVSGGPAIPMLGAPAMPVIGNAAPAVITQPVAVNPTPADEQKRLEQVAQEVARRRALREQAAPGGPAPAGQIQPGIQPQIPQGALQNPNVPQNGRAGAIIAPVQRR